MKETAARRTITWPADSSPAGDGSSFSERLKASEGSPVVDGTLDIRKLALQPSFQPHEDGRYHVHDLLKYHDRDFLQNAYQAILKRGPDAAGYSGFIEGLRSGQLNKIDVLARLRFSAEGRAKSVRVEGLLAPAAMRMAYRVPLVGYLLNLLVGVLRLPLMIQSHRQFEAQIFAQQEMFVEHVNHIALSLRRHAREVTQLLASHSASADRLGGQLQQEVKDLRAEQAAKYEMMLNRFAERTNYLEERMNDETLQQKQIEELLNLEASVRQQLEEQLKQEIFRHQENIWALDKRVGEVTSQLQEDLRLVQTESDQTRAREQQRIELLSGQSESLTSRVELLSGQSESLSGRVESLSRRATSEIERVLEKQQHLRAEMVLQSERLTRLLEEARKRLPMPFDQDQLQTIAQEEAHLLDAFYAYFDEQFRGGRAEIRERLKVYLPFLENSGVGTEAMPILDVGCGRGEWLELLRDNGLFGAGIDSNRTLVAQSRDRGLEIVEDDLMNYLRTVPDASLGGVTGFHIIEHLPLETLVKFLDETVRVLKPRGIIIVETPNPQNVLVGSCNFYFDPTHRNPLPSAVMKFFVESHGFVRVRILPLNPSNEMPVEGDSELVHRFNRYFYGPMDYGIVGWKSAGTMDD
jgi:SAM-dependent methyltransferase